MIKLVVCCIAIGLISILIIRKGFKNNVCTTFNDYYSDKDNNENCYYNPDYALTVPEIITRHGYPVEIHTVTTEDGYILNLFRIPHGRGEEKNESRKPVFLQHGLAYKSVSFINRGQKSLGFILANEGYDVWIGNFRGSVYSSNHTVLNYNDRKYWDFTFHEHGVYDLPAMLGLVREVTKKKIIYIGYSMGTTSMYIFGTTYPELASKTVSFFVNFAPAVFMKNMQSSGTVLVNSWPVLELLIGKLTNGKMSFALPLPQSIQNLLCFPYPFQLKACLILEMLTFGFNYEQLDPETLPITFFQNPDWGSLKAFGHYVQLRSSGKFQQYDHGKETNVELYGRIDPPLYDLSKFNIPVYIFRSDNDLTVTKEDIDMLYEALPEHTKTNGIFVVKNDIFNHMDFVLGKDVVPLLYDHVLEFLRSL